MGMKKIFRCLIPFDSWKNIDSRGLKKRNELRRAVGKDEVVCIGPSLSIDTARAQENNYDRVNQADDHIMDGRWAVPIAESPASWQSYFSQESTPKPSTSKEETERSLKGEKPSLVRVLINYMKTKFRLDQFLKWRKNRKAPSPIFSESDVSIYCSTSCSCSDCEASRAASELARRSISNASRQLDDERMEVIDLEQNPEEDDADEDADNMSNDTGFIEDFNSMIATPDFQ